jgi:hypothetical protein
MVVTLNSSLHRPSEMTKPQEAVRFEDQRFWSKVDRSAECWLWTAGVTKQGNGQFKVSGAMVQAHRYAWELVHGVPAPAVLRNLCGQHQCVRPSHYRPMPTRMGPTSLSRPALRRFADFVQETNDCWIWTGSVDRGGYGQFRDYDDDAMKAGRVVRAHRFAWEAAHGPLGPGI